MDCDDILRHVCEVMKRIYIHSYKDEFNDISDDCTLSSTEDGVPIRKLFIGNLAQRTTVKDLQNVFSKYGKLDGCFLKRNSGKSNYAFVTFSTVDDAMKARHDGNRKEIHLHNRDLRVMPADSWHQPDNVENQRSLLITKGKAANNMETGSTDSCSSPTKELIDDDSPIQKLNDDCLMHMFLYLPISDRVRIERVCKRWYAVSQQSWQAVKRLDLKLSTWGFFSEKGVQGVNTSVLRKVLLRCGRFLNHVDLSQSSNCPLRRSTLTNVGKYCPNLQSLDTRSLNISSSGVEKLTLNCGDIRKLIIGASTSSCDNDLLKLFAKNTKLKYLMIAQNFLLNGKCLTWLPAQGIEEIHLVECNAITSCHFSNAIREFSTLTTLAIDKCVSLNDTAIQAISCLGNSLRNLEITGYFPLLTTAAMSDLANLGNLERLNVAWNPVVTNKFLIALATQRVPIKHIDITGCNAVSDEGLAALWSLHHLNKLVMSYMGLVTDDALAQMQQLKYLECRGCPGIQDEGVSTMILLCSQLEYLDVSGCDLISNEVLEVAIKETKARKNNTILKMIVGGTCATPEDLTEISPLLQIVNVDLSDTHKRPDFDHGGFFPSEDDDIDQDSDDLFDQFDGSIEYDDYDLEPEWDQDDFMSGMDVWKVV
ncbi:putative RNA-binding protein EEED8.10 [Athalia rosae]|uniref:putative RNA-binding protein EEED8.10 n=1 Tax=Athalia rosae TaxID=37344 RepID=UPI002034846B|nr:putative RNA-binding protein EEED8.10 [Athalia rosae]